jgi:class 3 adenylate cyclase
MTEPEWLDPLVPREANRELEAAGLPTLAIGVGLHRGIGVAALISSRELMQCMFVGRILNLAARVQDLTRQRHVDIPLTRAVKDSLDRHIELRALPPTPVRGVTGPVAIFSVVSAAARDGAG